MTGAAPGALTQPHHHRNHPARSGSSADSPAARAARATARRLFRLPGKSRPLPPTASVAQGSGVRPGRGPAQGAGPSRRPVSHLQEPGSLLPRGPLPPPLLVTKTKADRHLLLGSKICSTKCYESAASLSASPSRPQSRHSAYTFIISHLTPKRGRGGRPTGADFYCAHLLGLVGFQSKEHSPRERCNLQVPGNFA